MLLEKLALSPFTNVLSRIFGIDKTYNDGTEVVSDVESLKYLYGIWDTAELNSSKKLYTAKAAKSYYMEIWPAPSDAPFYMQNDHISTSIIRFRTTPTTDNEYIVYFVRSTNLTEYSKFGFWFAVVNPSGNGYDNIGVMDTGLRALVFRAPDHNINDELSYFSYYTSTSSFIRQRNYLSGADILHRYPKQMMDKPVYIECDISNYSQQHYFAFIFRRPPGVRFENLEFLIMKPHVAR